MDRQCYGIGGHRIGLRQKPMDLRRYDLLDVTGADASLHGCCCVDIDLYGWTSTGLDIALEMRRDIDNESVLRPILQGVDRLHRDLYRRLEIGRKEMSSYLAR